MAKENRVASRYAQALWDLKGDASEQTITELRSFMEHLGKKPAVWNLLNDPTKTSSSKTKALDQQFPELSADSRAFLLLVLSKGRINLLPEIVDTLHHTLLVSRNMVEVTATSAIQPSQQQQEQLKSALEQRLKKKVLLRVTTDPKLLGGLILTTDEWALDLSVQGRLQRLHEYLAQ